jgi:hypothetical protein
MASFEAQLANVRSYVGDLRAAGRLVRDVVSASPASGSTAAALPVRVGPGASPGVILRGDTHVELGNPQRGSCGVVLWTTDTGQIVDGRVTLVGPDVPESSEGSLPFGQIIVVGGTELSPADYPAISQAQYVGDQIEGYMVRSSARSVWARVSKSAAAKGFDFACLGRALMALYKTSSPKVQAMEITFVTSDPLDVKKLESIAVEAHQVGLEMVTAHWKARGYELDCNLDCKGCHDKDVCDDVRKVIAATMRKEKAAHV